MPLSMHQTCAPIFLRQLGALSAILAKAEAYAEAKKIDPSTLLTDRLAPDMLPLSRQIQIASDAAKAGLARLAGVEAPSFPDTETTFADLQARIAKTVAFVNSIPADQVDGSEDKDIAFKFRGVETHFKGQAFLLHFVLPNFFFHVSMAYAILRHDGVALGKSDFLGAE
jgi:hypothetical protein